MSEYIWETVDNLFKTMHRQSRRVDELETRIVELERRLSERTTATVQQAKERATNHDFLPAERAA
ncbi:MAG: hypothetical protein H0V88_01960 [Pyrinomonadaceae bacterium]|nr:hypothetical protein [Pyrinomonadaceae bacterium]